MNHQDRYIVCSFDDPHTIIFNSEGIKVDQLLLAINGEKLTSEQIRSQYIKMYERQKEFHEGMVKAMENQIEYTKTQEFRNPLDNY